MVKIKQLLLLIILLLTISGCSELAKTINYAFSIKKQLSQLELSHTSSFEEDKAFVLGQFNYKNDERFVKVDHNLATKDLYLHIEVYKAFKRMYNKAREDGIELKIISGTRNFEEQKRIWEHKWENYNHLNPVERTQRILEYSSMPSTSRHHWGTDLDLNSLNNSYFNSGKGKAEYEWLMMHAKTFGFYQAYTDQRFGRTGYKLERWHWSYLPLASQYLNFYNAFVDYKDIKGFKGDTLAKANKMIEYFVNGLSQQVIDYSKQ